MGEGGQALGTSPGSESKCEAGGSFEVIRLVCLYSPGAKAPTSRGYVTLRNLLKVVLLTRGRGSTIKESLELSGQLVQAACKQWPREVGTR